MTTRRHIYKTLRVCKTYPIPILPKSFFDNSTSTKNDSAQSIPFNR